MGNILINNNVISIRDRKYCYVCNVELNETNAYSRSDTSNKLHSLCKYHYIEQQKIRNKKYTKEEKTVTLVINVCGKPQQIVFRNKEEKNKYIKERQTLQKFSMQCEMMSSCVGCTEDWGTGVDLRCDECNGLLRYNKFGELQCEICDLIAESLPIPTDRKYYYDKKMLQDKNTIGQTDWIWIDGANGSAFDIFYQKVYSKRLKK